MWSSEELSADLSGPLTVAAGDTVVHALDLTNHGDVAVVVSTAGDVIARIVDPATGETVGGFSGWHTQPLVRFRVEPGRTERIPLLVGTVRLADAAPLTAGEWALTAPLDLEDGRRPVAGPFPVTLT